MRPKYLRAWSLRIGYSQSVDIHEQRGELDFVYQPYQNRIQADRTHHAREKLAFHKVDNDEAFAT